MTRFASPGRGRLRAGISRLVAVIALAPATLGLAGCISEDRERQIGNEMAATVNAQIPFVRNPVLNAYVGSLGEAIAAVGGRPDLDYRFYIIDSQTVNAFALPGGHVYVTRGLLERTESGNELAGVLAHEIGHIVERHGVEKLERHLRTGSLVNVLYSVILGGEPAILRQNAIRLAGFLWNANHSREDEQEADRLAVEYLITAGVDPSGVVTLLENLLEGEVAGAASPATAWFSSHPLTAVRIAETREEIRADLLENPLPAPAQRMRITHYDAFLRLLASLPPSPHPL